ncbi:hypothetical protein AB1L88_06975 [Tautonia sp. JC769]|uniref:hypothetical protein n=1 Tax=Tautonia sp. JC769 TaxID=3232135 RepID=UPI003458C080
MTRIAAAIALLAWLPGCAGLAGHREPLEGRVVPCPCDLDGLAFIPAGHPRAIISRDSDLSTARYHPGAFVTYRVFDPDTDPKAGNQCSFDRDGRLIPAGPAAGTPDFISPERSVLGHFVVDVLPFHRLGWMEYHRRGWAPIALAPCE